MTVTGGAAPGGKRQQRGGCQQEHDGQRHQQDGQRDLVRRFTALGAFHHGDHAVEEGFARVDAALHHQPVGQHARAARHRGEIAAGFADHRRGFAGDGAFIHRGAAFNHFAVARDDVAGFHQHHIAFAQRIGRHRPPLRTVKRFRQFLRIAVLVHPFQAVGLRLAAAFGQRFGEVGEQHGKPQPQATAAVKPALPFSCPAAIPMASSVVSTLPTQTRNITGLRHCTRGLELFHRIQERRARQRRIKQRQLLTTHDSVIPE